MIWALPVVHQCLIFPHDSIARDIPHPLRLIALSQVRPYLVAARSSHGDFGPRFAHRPCHLDACRPLSFCGVALKRVAEASRDLFGHRIRKTRVIRTSNGYAFIDPKAGQHPVSSGNSSKSDFPSGTPIQESFLPKPAPAPRVLNPDNPLKVP